MKTFYSAYDWYYFCYFPKRKKHTLRYLGAQISPSYFHDLTKVEKYIKTLKNKPLDTLFIRMPILHEYLGLNREKFCREELIAKVKYEIGKKFDVELNCNNFKITYR